MSEIRICENCKHHNSINSLECENCGYDLSFIIPIDENSIEDSSAQTSNSASLNAIILSSIDGNVIIEISDGLIVGRDGEYSSAFEKSNFVSRKHAIFNLEDNDVYISDASTNGTFVNDRKLEKFEKVKLSVGDKVSFADVVFEVKNNAN